MTNEGSKRRNKDKIIEYKIFCKLKHDKKYWNLIVLSQNYSKELLSFVISLSSAEIL